jgi:endonuclease YncB( thermonuclease family)
VYRPWPGSLRPDARRFRFSGDIEINAAMVTSGNAIAVGRYEAEEADARRASRGIWASSFEHPADYRARTASHSPR